MYNKMSQQNKSTLQSAINTDLADNTSGDISAADVRDNLINMTDSLLFNNGSQGITGSLEVTEGITGSLQGTATTASYVETAQTASFVVTAQTASYVENAQTASFVELAQTASYVENAQTASYTVNAQTASYVENAVSASHVLTASYVNPLNQEVILTGNITASGDLRLTTAGNAVVRPVIDLVPNGTASYNPNSTNTTAYANYGINLITSSNATSYCLRLPETPVKGKAVTLINNSGINVVVFPSVVGGSINGVIDGVEIIPSDGKSYTYDCYENPLPGGWSLSTSPSSGNTAINTGVINWNYSSSNSSSIGFINDNIKGYGNGQSGGSPYLSIFPAYPQYDAGGYLWSWGANTYSFAFSHLFPDSIPNTDVWQSVNSIQISTNLSSSLESFLYTAISVGSNREIFYNPSNPNYNPNNVSPWTPNSFFQQQNWLDFNTNILTPWHTSHPGTQGVYSGLSSWAFAGQTTYSVTPGTFTPSIASPYTSDNVGDPGTLTINLSNFPSYVNTTSLSAIGLNMIGRNYIGSLYDPVEGLLDVWYSQQMGPFLGLYPGAPSEIPNIKFTTIFNVQI
jgi:hypothetical protein